MAESGTTRPNPAGLEFFKRFVAALEALEANALVRLDTNQGTARFTEARSGLLLGEVQIRDDPQNTGV